MNAFDRIIGYSEIKQELVQIADTMKNREVYQELGVSTPRGLLLHGDPGLGKTLMAKCLIEASGRTAFTCRKTEPNGEFIKVIKETFDQAMENAPAIVFLDDMDKFANDDDSHRDSEEYVTVQSCIDDAKDKEVFVLATANDTSKLPRSLVRVGRFDRRIKVETPEADDAEKIIAHYLSQKRLGKDLDPRVIATLLRNRSCATLETVINEAGLIAGYRRTGCVTMEHVLEACLMIVHNLPAMPENRPVIDLNIGKEDALVCYHEAGHAVAEEVLNPGSVSLVVARCDDRHKKAFTNGRRGDETDPLYSFQADIISSLAGRAAVELKYNRVDMGAARDINDAFDSVQDLVENYCYSGFNLYTYGRRDDSPSLSASQEAVISAEMERYYRKAKEILSKNMDFLDAVAQGLAEKGALMAADIQRIRESCRITPVTI